MNKSSLRTSLLVTLCAFLGITSVVAGTVKYQYDQAGRLIEAQYGTTATIRYEYDPMGNLLKRSVVLGSSMLYIPFYQAGPGTFLGIAVTNASSSPANLEFRAFGEEGTMLPFPDNPCVEVLQSQEQMAKLASEIFKVEGSAPQAGWIQLSSDNSQVGAFFESANNALTQMDGSVGVTAPARKFYFTRVHEGPAGFRGQGAGTFLSLANPHDSSITAQLKLYALTTPGGTAVHQVGATVTRVIPAKGVLYRLISDLFGTVAVPGGYVEVEIADDKSAVGFELIQLSGQTTLFGLNANYGNQTSELFSAQLASASSLFTGLKLINSSTETRTLTLRAIANDGTALAPNATATLGPGEMLEKDAGQLFAFTDPAPVGSLHVQANGPGVIGDVVFGATGNVQFASSMPLQTQKFNRVVFGQVANGMGLFTGLALYNPGTGTADVRITIFSQKGVVTGEKTVELKGGERLSQLVNELAPSTAGQIAGFIVIQSNLPLIAQQVFADTGLNMYTAVPPSVIN